MFFSGTVHLKFKWHSTMHQISAVAIPAITNITRTVFALHRSLLHELGKQPLHVFNSSF